MSEIEQRIAEAMWRKERCGGFEWSSDEAPPVYHRLAAIAVKELGPTQEWARRWVREDAEFAYGYPTADPDLLPPLSSGVSRVSRYVTEWVPE